MASSRRIADLIIKIGADSYEFKKVTASVEKDLAKIGKSMDKIGKNLSMAITAPLAALGVVSLKNIDGQLQSEAKLLNALKGRADVQARLLVQASELQNRSTLGDEVIVEQQAYFASLKMNEAQIKSSTEAAMEMSYAFAQQGMTFQTASKYIVQMYGGTIGRLGMLIPQLKEFTAEQLKNGEGVKYILANYSGFAETAASVGLGFMTQISNQWGDMLEEFGRIMLPYVQKIGACIKSIIGYLQALDPETKKIIVLVGALVAAVGPLFLTLGGIIKLLPVLTVGFTSLLSPVGLVITAVTALGAAFAYAYIQKQKLLNTKANKLIEDGGSSLTPESLIDKNKSLEKEIVKLTKIRDNLTGGVASMSPGVGIGNPVVKIAKLLKSSDIKTYNDQIKLIKEEIAVNNQAIDILNKKKEASDAAASALNELIGELGLLNAASSEANGLIPQLNKQIEALEEKKLFAKDVETIKKLNAEIEILQGQLSLISGKQNANTSSIGSGVSTVSTMKPPEVDSTSLVPSNLDDTIKYSVERYIYAITSFQDSINSICADFSVEGFAMIGDMLGQAISGSLSTGGALEMLGNFFASFLSQIGAQLITFGTTILGFQQAIAAFLSNIWNPIGALGMIAAGIVLIGVASTIKSSISKKSESNMPKLANGGLAFGPTYALVGDNKNAQIDPEVVAPLSKLKGMIGGSAQNIHVSGALRVSGSDLALVLDKNNVRITTMR